MHFLRTVGADCRIDQQSRIRARAEPLVPRQPSDHACPWMHGHARVWPGRPFRCGPRAPRIRRRRRSNKKASRMRLAHHTTCTVVRLLALRVLQRIGPPGTDLDDQSRRRHRAQSWIRRLRYPELLASWGRRRIWRATIRSGRMVDSTVQLDDSAGSPCPAGLSTRCIAAVSATTPRDPANPRVSRGHTRGVG